MTYTEADVERDADAAEGAKGENSKAAISRLRTAALEGAKVPGLEGRIAHLVKDRSDELDRANALQRELEAAQRQVATLTADKDATRRQLDRVHGHLIAIAKSLGITEALSGPEFEVAAQETARMVKTVESACDALRAQVEQARAIASGVASRMPDDVAGTVCRDILSALSAPPAETTPEDRCPRGDHAVWEHERGGKHTLCGTDAETTASTEREPCCSRDTDRDGECLWHPAKR